MPQFQVISSPAGGTIAVATQAAGGAGRKNVCTGIIFSALDLVSTSVIRKLRLRDGASGAGTILLEADLLTGTFSVEYENLFLVGSANTAMTVEFTANGVATEFQTITLRGIII